MLRASLKLASLGLMLGVTACGSASEHAPPPSSEPAAEELIASPQEAAACVGTEAPSQALPVDMFAVVDSSGSMQDATVTGVSKWSATKQAFKDFLASAPHGMRFGLSLFPLLDQDSNLTCDAVPYARAALPIDDVSHMMGGAMNALDAVKPTGQTPTAPALTAALDTATAYALEHPDRSVVVVLATDGLPTACAPTDAASLAAVARDALRGPGHVRTLVVVSESPGDQDAGQDLSDFNGVAEAGGTGHVLSIDPAADFAPQLTQALGSAATRRVACDLALPEPPVGQRLDYDAVNVVAGERSRVTLARVSGPSACAIGGGWYYDVDPETGAPSRLNICQSSCERASKLTVELGCRTVVR